MHRRGVGLAAAAVAGVAACALGPPSFFFGRINGAFFEPTGTVWAWSDALTPAPELQSRSPGRFSMVGVYAYFDSKQDQGSLSGSQLEDLKHEIHSNDWVALQWDDLGKVENGEKFTAVLVRDTTENIYRVTDTTAMDGTAGFTARVRFRRGTLPRGAAYKCPTPSPPLLCRAYVPLGGRLRVEVELQSVNRAQDGNVRADVTLKVEKANGDPDDVQTGEFTGTLSASVASERVAEANMDVLDLFTQFNLQP